MATRDKESSLELSRRRLLAAAGVGGGALLAASIIGIGEGETALAPSSPEDVATTPVAGLHLQFGADASSEMLVSWHTLQAVRHPRVMLGRLSNNSRSARNRPWMPCAGNHENELSNGPIGYQAYQTYFSLPAADGQTDVTRGLWYGSAAAERPCHRTNCFSTRRSVA